LSQTHRKPLSEKSNTKASENAEKSSKIF
jgi:hypothetical protein